MLIMRSVRPLLLIRICGIQTDRIGHFVPDIAEHIGRKYSKSAKVIDLYYLRGPISNTQWAQMAKRSPLKINGNWLSYVSYWNRTIPGGDLHQLPSSCTESRDIEGLIHKFDCSIPFLPSEDSECKDWLASHGWTKGEPFVVFQVRDSEYLKQQHPNYDWSYHSYRDSDIKTYLPAMEWLASQGVWVVRMGRIMATPLQSSSKRIIDYAFGDERSDLLDIWLFANCDACVSTASGPDLVSAIYRKPLLCVNASPIGLLFSMYDSIWVPKNLFWMNSGLSLNLKEYLDNTYLHSDEYLRVGINLVDLTHQEILSAVQEFWARTQNLWVETDSEQRQQSDFWEVFLNWPLYDSYHGWRHKSSRIGGAWLTSKGPEYMTSKW